MGAPRGVHRHGAEALKSLTIAELSSGGLITNYQCSSACRHCLYGSSPRWEKEYITRETAEALFRTMRSLHIASIHIGGGEPFLNISALEEVLKTAHERGITVEYVETNSSWFHDEESAARTLSALKKHGLTTLLISISPFHNEFIPFRKVKGVIGACERADVAVFPWMREFYPNVSALDESKPHRIEEYAAKFGRNYLRDIPSRYRITMRGRAVDTYKDVFAQHGLDEILESKPCSELASTGHFHFDLFGNYIPGLCSGLAIHHDDLGETLDFREYPFITMLYSEGIAAFLAYAKGEGFQPADSYLS
ncbi:MAG: radical SAM protein, partial [Spirochaetota bacterium]